MGLCKINSLSSFQSMKEKRENVTITGKVLGVTHSKVTCYCNHITLYSNAVM